MRRMLSALGIIVLVMVLMTPFVTSLPDQLADLLPDITKWEWLSKEKPIQPKEQPPIVSAESLASLQNELGTTKADLATAKKMWGEWETYGKAQRQRADDLESKNGKLSTEAGSLKKINESLNGELQALKRAGTQQRREEVNIRQMERPTPPTREQMERARTQGAGQNRERREGSNRGGGQSRELF